MIKRLQFCGAAYLVAFTAGCSQSTNKAPSTRFQGERPPTFRSSQLLRSDILRGRNYTIDETVPVSEYSYMFTIRSAYGVIPARGMDMLELRLREMAAIEKANRLVEDGQFGEGVRDSIEKTEKGLNEMVTDPAGALARAPKGLGRMLKQSFDATEGSSGGEARRKVASQIGCDPETKNPVLGKLLEKIALKRGLGGFVTGQTLDLVIPGMNLLTTTAEIKDTLATTPLYKINDQIEHELESMGVDRYVRKKFCRDRNYTTVQRMMYMQHLRAIKGIPGAAELPAEAVEVGNEAEALAVIRELRLVVDLQKTKGIQRLEYIGLPLARMADGRAVVVGSADYLTNTKELIDVVKDYRTDHAKTPTVFLMSGRVSEAAKQTLRQAGIDVTEKGEPPA